MKRLSLEALRANSTSQIMDLEVIKGGVEEYCHDGLGKYTPAKPCGCCVDDRSQCID